MHDTPPKSSKYGKTCFWKVKDGHLTILPDCPYFSFWPEIWNCKDPNPVMDALALEIHSKLIGKRKRKTLEWSLKTVTTVGTGKSTDFYIFVKVGYYPLLHLACICIDYYSLTLVVYCIWSYIVIVIWIDWLELIILFYNFFYFYLFDIGLPMFNHMAYSAIAWPNVSCNKLSLYLLIVIDEWHLVWNLCMGIEGQVLS